MKKTKKALLAAFACSVALAGAFGLAACNNGGDDKGGHSHSWGDWTVEAANKPTSTAAGKATRTCSGSGDCDAATEDKEHPLPALNNTDYTVGNDSATCSAAGSVQYTYNKDGVNVSFTVDTPINSEAHDYGEYVDTDPAGHYKVCSHNDEHKTTSQAHDTNGTGGTCSVCGYDPNHEHTYNEAEWAKDETGHWHAASCAHTEVKGDFAAHTPGAWEVDQAATETAEGKQHRECTVCHYVENGTIPKLPKTVTGGIDADTAVDITAGRYKVVINSEEVERFPGYPEYGTVTQVDAFYFKIVGGAEAKKYTIGVEGLVGYMTPYNGSATTEPYDVLLEPGDSFIFSVSADEAVPEGVIFKITESEAPAPGDVLRPIKVVEGVNGKDTGGDDEEKVYFKLDHNVYKGKKVKVTFGEGVYVNSYGFKADWNTETAAGNTTPVNSGAIIQTSEYNSTYLYATSRNERCDVTFEIYYEEGEKEKPFTATLGADKPNAVSDAQGDQWYKLEPTATGKYIIKYDLAEATISTYADVNGLATGTATGGVPLVVNLTSGTPVYITANNGYYGAFNFTITPYDDVADKGSVPGDPIELSVNNFEVYNSTKYYKFTATQTGMISIKYSGEGNLYIHQCDENYEQWIDYEKDEDGEYVVDEEGNKKQEAIAVTNSLAIDATADTTYYFKMTGEGASGTFKFAAGEFTAHDYVITVSDGTTTFDNVTVKLMKDGTALQTGTTADGGKVTFTQVDSTKGYKLELEGLPATHGYYGYSVARNADATTEFTATVYAKRDYSIKLKLPEGAEAIDLSGVNVTFTSFNNETDTTTVKTDASGVAKINVIDPKFYKNGEYQVGAYMITVEVPAECALNGKYVFVAPSEGIKLNNENITKELTLSKVVSYTLTLKDESGAPLAEGTTVTVNGVTGTTNASGEVTIATVAGEYAITVGGNYVTSVKTSATEFTMEVACSVVLNGAYDTSSAPAIPVAESAFAGSVYSGTYYKFTAQDAGTYVINITPKNLGDNTGIDEITNTAGDILLGFDGATGGYSNDGTVITSSKMEYYVTSVTAQLKAGDTLILKIYGSGTISVAKQ